MTKSLVWTPTNSWLCFLCAAALCAGAPRAANADDPLKPHEPSYVYKTIGERQLHAELFYPPDWKATDRRPAIVFFSGGGFKNGGTTQFLTQSEYFAKRGLVTVRAEYRDKTRDQATVEICLEDAISAIRWVRKHAAELGVDANRIVGSGGSAGGFLASSVAATRGLDVAGDDASISHVPNALVLFNPVVDLAALERSTAEGDQALLKQISPARNLTSDYPPTVILIGSEDSFMGQVQKFVEDASKLGVKIEIDISQGQPHAFFSRDPWTGKTAARADQFLQSIGYLRAEPVVDPPKSRERPAAKNKAKASGKKDA